MLDDSFESTYRRLVSAFGRYHDTPRNPDLVSALAAAHWELHRARGAMARERNNAIESDRARRAAARVAVSGTDLARLRVTGIGNEY